MTTAESNETRDRHSGLRRVTEASIYKLLVSLDERRKALGLVGMPEEQAEVHIRALAKLTAQQFMAVLALPDLEREGSIRALEAGQRRDHSTPEVMAVAISEIDGRLLFRWSCSCGAKAGGDYFSAAEARAAVDRHRGVVPEAPPERPTSKRLPPGARNRERQRAALFGTED